MTLAVLKTLTVGLAGLTLAACGDGVFGPPQARVLLESQELQLDNEQVSLSYEQVACGEREDLWVVLRFGERRAAARLTDAARSLGFSDDVQIGAPDFRSPYAQVRGRFRVRASDIKLLDVDSRTKVGEARAGLLMDHKCFDRPLPLMGVHKGQFSETSGPTFRFRLSREDWQYDQLLH
jgi:hypothetical protein